MTWFTTRKDSTGDFHVLPVADLKEHDVSWRCWCAPRIDEELPLIVHNSMDQREQYEEGREPS